MIKGKLSLTDGGGRNLVYYVALQFNLYLGAIEGCVPSKVLHGFKKINHKDRVNNFVELPGESVRNSWDRFTSFLRSVPIHRIDDELLKEYFYRGQNDNNNNKVVLDTIAGGSYGECTYVDIAEKLEKIFRNNKAWNTRKLDIERNTFAVQASHNPIADEIHEEMSQMRTELGWVLKHVTSGAENVNAVNCLAKPPLPVDEYYYEEDSFALK